MIKTQYPPNPILIVDDESDILESFATALRSENMNNILTCQDSHRVMSILSKTEVEMVMLDLYMPGIGGEELLANIMRDYSDIPVLIITGINKVETAVRCIKLGAYDYIIKPVEKSRLITAVGRALEIKELRRENRLLREHVLTDAVQNRDAFSGIITENDKMLSIFKYAESIAKTSQPLLITGETGTGKELAARAIHHLSGRQGEFVCVNVAGLNEEVFDDTLYGHVKGAFTGANEVRKGMVKLAGGGTLFLDEMGDLAAQSQVKLLRFLQEHEYFPLGADMPQRSDARIIAATNKDISALGKAPDFRRDLFFRLRTHHIHLPPLRDRLDDLPLLITHFINKAATALGQKSVDAPKKLVAALALYSFPGNLRELEGMIFDAVSRCKTSVLSFDDFSSMSSLKAPDDDDDDGDASLGFNQALPSLKKAEHMLIAEAMRRSHNNQSKAAQILGLTRQGLNKRLKSLSL